MAYFGGTSTVASVSATRRTVDPGMPSALSAFQSNADSYKHMSPPEQAALALKVAGTARRSVSLAAEGGKLSLREAEDQERDVERLCVSCWRLAWVIVREQAEARYGRERARDMLPDLMSEANLALVKAATTFDISLTPKFPTYAARVVRDHIRAILSREGYIRLAPSWGRVKRIAATRIPELTTALGRPPSVGEIQADLLERCLEWAYGRLSLEESRLPNEQRKAAAMAKLRKQGMLGAVRDIEEVLVASRSVLSLDQPVSPDGPLTLGEGVVGAGWDEGYRAVEMSGLADALREALTVLSEREQRIVLLRYGFDGSDGWTYGMIAEEFGVSSERVRQIERAALEKLSASPSSPALADFMS